MSRVANKPVEIPSGIEVKVNGNTVSIKGPKGHADHQVHQSVTVTMVDNVLQFTPRDESTESESLTATHRILVNNMVIGIHKGFDKTLELRGVGYRVQIQGSKVNLTLGLSHPVVYDLPKGVTAEAPNNTTLILKGSDKQQVGQVAAEIRAKRPPEIYKGKGIRYAGENIVLKETKKK